MLTRPKIAVIPSNPTIEDQSGHFITLLKPAYSPPSPPVSSISLEANLQGKYCTCYQILERDFMAETDWFKAFF